LFGTFLGNMPLSDFSTAYTPWLRPRAFKQQNHANVEKNHAGLNLPLKFGNTSRLLFHYTTFAIISRDLPAAVSTGANKKPPPVKPVEAGSIKMD